MKLTYEFTVGVPVDRAWNTMLDLERIAPCLPGAAVWEENGAGEYAGTMKVKIGPITATYKGTVNFEEKDESDHRAVLRATGRDARGQGTASANIVATLREEGNGTKVNVETELKLTGRATQFGRGIAQEVATKLLDQFAVCLEREISGTAEAATADGPRPNAQAAPAAGATVEGAVVAGSGPSEAAASAPTTDIRQPAAQEAPRPEPPRQPEAFDLGAAGRGAALKRLAPALAGAGLLVVLIRLLRRRR